MTEYLCVGGSHDGEWWEIDEYPPRRDLRLVCRGAEVYDSAGYLSYQIETYRPVKFCEHPNEYYVFVHDTVQDGDILRTLIDGYKGKNK